MADPLTYANSDEYVLVNPNDPKVGHLVYDAPMVDTDTKQFIRDPVTGKIKVYRMVIWGTKGLTQAQVESLIENKNASMIETVGNITKQLEEFLNSDDEDLNQLAELVTQIKENKSTIAALLEDKVNKTDITSDLASQETSKVPTAKNVTDIYNQLVSLQNKYERQQIRLSTLQGQVETLIVTGGGGSGSGSGANVITIPTVDKTAMVIGRPTTFNFSAESLLSRGSIDHFTVTLTSCMPQSVDAIADIENTALGRGTATFTVLEGDEIEAGGTALMTVVAVDNAGNTSVIVSREISLTANPVAPDITSGPEITTIVNASDINAPEQIFLADENTISDDNDTKGNPLVYSMYVLPLPEDYATRGLDTSIVYVDDII